MEALWRFVGRESRPGPPEAPLKAPDKGPEAPLKAPDKGPEAPLKAPDKGPEAPLKAPDKGPEAPLKAPDKGRGVGKLRRLLEERDPGYRPSASEFQAAVRGAPGRRRADVRRGVCRHRPRGSV